MQDYKLISADGHVIEPPNLWVDRMPKKYKDRIPHMVSLPDTDAWIIEGAADPLTFGLNTVAGLPPERYNPKLRFSEVWRGGWDPKARVEEQDQGKVDAEIMFPTPRISNSIFWNNSDPEFHIACVRAYNDWLSEYCSYAPDRLGGVAMLPNVGAQAAIDEMHRAIKLPGIVTVMCGKYPNGGAWLDPSDDPFWAAMEETGVPLNIHVGFASGPPTTHEKASQGFAFTGAFTGALRIQEAPYRALELIYHRVFDRFPKLKVVLAETDCGWVPYFMEQIDDRVPRQNPKNRVQFKLKPSEYFTRNFWYTIVFDSFGLRNRHEIGVERILWSNDFPHASCDWPNDWKRIAKDFKGMPAGDQHAVLAGNALTLYGLDKKKATAKAKVAATAKRK
ncbi:MAG: amidohydrolase [Dehalococcoidia bacterium]|nr:amidohydrolase [Dehalococcoidia bacterium]